MAIKSFYLHGKMIFAFQMMDNGDEAKCAYLLLVWERAKKIYGTIGGRLRLSFKYLDYVIGFGFYIARFVLTCHSLIATVSEVSVSIYYLTGWLLDVIENKQTELSGWRLIDSQKNVWSLCDFFGLTIEFLHEKKFSCQELSLRLLIVDKLWILLRLVL